MGPDQKDTKAIRILNRIITWGDDGIEYEADQRHAEIIIKQMGLREESRSVVTPGEKADTKQVQSERKLGPKETTLYRAMAARGNYLSQDRGDIKYAVKERK